MSFHVHDKRVVPVDLKTAFDVAADVERYPSFLPFCKAARIAQQNEDVLVVDNVFGVGPIRTRFRSRAVLSAPASISVTSSDPPFGELRIEWTFQALEKERTQVSFSLSATFLSPQTETLLALLAPNLAGQVLRRFVCYATKA